MAKIQADLPEDLNKALKLYALRYNFEKLPEALTYIVRRFFENEDYDYFLEENLKNKKNKIKNE